MSNIFESESRYHAWRIKHGVPISYSISDVASDTRANEKYEKEQIHNEVLDLFSDESIRDLLRNNQYYKQINFILEQLDGMIAEELKNIKNRLKLLIKHKNPSQVTKLFKFILEY